MSTEEAPQNPRRRAPVVYWYPGPYQAGHSRQGNLTEQLNQIRPTAYVGTSVGGPGLMPKVSIGQGDLGVTVVSEHLPDLWARLRRRAPSLVDRLRWRRIAGSLRRHGFAEPVFVGADVDASFFRACPYRPRLLDLMDPHLDGDVDAYRRGLRAVISTTEGAVASARALAGDLSELGRPAALVPNGCRRTDPPRPRSGRFEPGAVGYLGTIDQRIDIGLLASVVSRLPEVAFLFGGRVNPDQAAAFAPVRDAPNVSYVGEIDDSLTDEFMSAIAVGLLPFETGWVGDRINPVKMWEYAAFGLPMVATEIAECHEGGVVVVTEAASFADAIQAALVADHPDAGALALAATGTWEIRALELEAALVAQERSPLRS